MRPSPAAPLPRAALGLAAALLLLPSPALATLPLAFQGQLLTAADGGVVSDTLAMDFRIYEGEAAGAAVLWESLDQQVAVEEGLFVAYLDVDADPELPAALAAGKELWLGVTIGQGAELAGRIPLAGSLGTVLAQSSQSLLGCGQGNAGVPVGGQCLQLVTEAALAAAVAAHASNAGAHHARFTAAEALTAVNGDVDHWTAAKHPQDLVHAGSLAQIATTGLATDLLGELPERTIPDDVVREDDLSPVATSGKYEDLSGLTDLLAGLQAQLADLQTKNLALQHQLEQLQNPLPYPEDGSPLLIYVAADGNDQNSGLAAGSPKKTLQAAWDLLPRFVSGDIEIRLGMGIYAPAILADREVAAGSQVLISGVSGDREAVQIRCPQGVAGHALRIVNVRGGTLQRDEYPLELSTLTVAGDCSGYVSIYAEKSNVDLYDMVVKENSSSGIILLDGTFANAKKLDVHHNSQGFILDSYSTLTIREVNIHDNTGIGIGIQRFSVLNCSDPASTVKDNGGAPVALFISSATAWCQASMNRSGNGNNNAPDLRDSFCLWH